MAGSASAATILGIVGATVAATGTAYGVYNGQQQQATQNQAITDQKTAQETATGAALSTQRKNEVAQGAANQKTPDISSILQRALAGGKGSSSTMLTGPGGVDSSGYLGKSTLLGS